MMLLAILPRNASLDVKSLVLMLLDWNMALNAFAETWYEFPCPNPWSLEGIPDIHF